MNIVIKIMEGDKIIEHKSLSTEQKNSKIWTEVK